MFLYIKTLLKYILFLIEIAISILIESSSDYTKINKITVCKDRKLNLYKELNNIH